MVTREKIDEAAAVYKDHFGSDVFNYEGWWSAVNYFLLAIICT